MIRCSVEDLEPGMVLGKSLFDQQGMLLLAAGHRLDSALIPRIKSRGYYSVLIFREGTEEIIPEDVISEEVRKITSQKVQQSIENLQERMQKYLPAADMNLVNVLRERKEFENVIDVTDLKHQLRYVLEEVMTKDTTRRFANSLRSASNYQYEHSVDVMLLSVMLGIAYDYNYPELLQLGTAALLHDIGKTVLRDLIDRPEEELRIDQKILFKEHPVFGSILLEKSTAGHFMERAAILQHHERQDGNGYPLHKFGANQAPIQSKQVNPNRIFRFAEIIAVANTYDNYASPRLGHAPLPPVDALKIVTANAGIVLNSHIVQKLTNIINLYPQGSLVRIDNCSAAELIGVVGAVKEYNARSGMMSLILFTDAQGNDIKPTLHTFSGDPKLRLRMKL